MIELTEKQKEQVTCFFYLITKHIEDVELYPVKDKDGTIRLGICLRNDGDLYLQGILFLGQDDSLVKRMEFYDQESILTERPASRWGRFSNWVGGIFHRG